MPLLIAGKMRRLDNNLEEAGFMGGFGAFAL